MPIQNTKLVMSHAQPNGWFSPQTPTPLATWELRSVGTSSAIGENRKKAIHHHLRVFSSQIVATFCVIQLKLRSFLTSGIFFSSGGQSSTTPSSSCGSGWAGGGVAVVSAILERH